MQLKDSSVTISFIVGGVDISDRIVKFRSSSQSSAAVVLVVLSVVVRAKVWLNPKKKINDRHFFI